MNDERHRIFSAVAASLVAAAVAGMLLVSCGTSTDDDSDGCDWFALAAAPAATKVPLTSNLVPASPPAWQKPTPTPTSKKPHRHRDIDTDLCD
ncbi:hypothetical protein [Streptomyces sp. NBC_01763]|uniref:hypothetical protein n=1 Tax=Streptomyces sp. NBC_01763 TaxID=2975934 RepID=UPI002DDC076A|nr:hypothetical protein [Streptomyces sp. NBC_01763]WSC35667.1 hypothetical protein OHA08_09220 [Streptomyces sp. NBC_01763]